MLDQARFSFIADALNAGGGFMPSIVYSVDENGLTKPTGVAGACYLVPYPRESATKFAARAAVAVYENHLRAACERFVGYLARKPPLRDGTDSPLASAFIADADWRGNALDVFWQSFMFDARARGSMLVLMDMPAERPKSLADQIERRAVPYLTAITPERVQSYDLDERGRFTRVRIYATAIVDDKPKAVAREWDADEWRVIDGDRVIERGGHSFKRCPVLAFTESGEFPCYGTFEQIALLSRRVFNARSELDEILRSQTFSLLTYQVPADQAATFSAADVAGVIGTHNMLIHSGDAPAFIAPPDGPAATYLSVIEKLEESIRRISLTIEDPRYATAESGLALAIRFQSLNSALAGFAMRMADLERQVWDLFAAAVGTRNRAQVQWASDFQLADTQRELDALRSMQETGFPDEALREKRKQIAAEEFATLDPDRIDAVMAALDEEAFEAKPPPAGPSGNPESENGEAPEPEETP